jgi:PKD repeat protein
VYDKDSIYMNIFAPVVLEDVSAIVAPTPLPPVVGAPIADFYASITAGAAPLTVNFSNASLNAPTGFNWDFTNDGNTDATTPSPSYTYSAPGTYTVRLRASNAFGSNDAIKASYISVSLPAPSAGNTNLGIQLGGPSQVQRNVPFQISVIVGNDGHLTATNVLRTIRIPFLKGEQIVLSGIPAGSTITTANDVTTVLLPLIGTLPSGSSYGPFFFTGTAPTKSGTVVINGSVTSPEPDSTAGDNSTSISIEVKP